MQTVRTSSQAAVRYFIVAARLRRGATLEQAQAELTKVGAQLAAGFPDTHRAGAFAPSPSATRCSGGPGRSCSRWRAQCCWCC